MIKYEIKKNLIYNKGWILILLIIFQLFIGFIFGFQNQSDSRTLNYQYYHEHLQGKITDEKINFINNEEKMIHEFDEKRELLEQQYKNDEINDEQYIHNLDILNEYQYRASVFENVKEYVSYIQEDINREYINEDHINSYLKTSIPYLLIIVIILNVVISFQNEESMYLLTKTTLIGKNKLIKTKILTLIIINSIIFILYFLIHFLLNFNFSYISELFVRLDSTRMFEGTFFQGNILTIIIIFFFMQWLAVIFLSFITSLLYLKIKIGSLKLCILEIGTYVISFFLFINTKWLYYILPIGFFNPVRYFVSENLVETEKSIQSFHMNELIFIIVVSFFVLMLIYLKRKKMFKIPIFMILLILLSGCQNEKLILSDIKYSNHNGFTHNEIVSVFTIENQLLDMQTGKQFQINRNPLKDIKTISTGYMYYQYFYYIEIGETEWSLQRLNTENFEQEEIYKESIYERDVLGNIISSPSYNKPLQIHVNNEDVYIIFKNRVEVVSSNHNNKVLFDKTAYIVSFEQENMYYQNDKNQLVVFNTQTHEHKICLESLISNAYIDNQYIYYIKLKDETLYRLDRSNNTSEQLINEQINFFQVIDDKIYYTTTVSNKGINIYIPKSGQREKILDNYKVSTFSVLDSKILFSAYDDELHQIFHYYLNNDNIQRIESYYE